jgi:RNA polymerase sigma factor (sigma-70 family)
VLLAALARLTPTQREVVLLKDLEGWDHRAIASALGVSEGMSRQHLFVARGALREVLGAKTLEDHTEGHRHG